MKGTPNSTHYCLSKDVGEDRIESRLYRTRGRIHKTFFTICNLWQGQLSWSLQPFQPSVIFADKAMSLHEWSIGWALTLSKKSLGWKGLSTLFGPFVSCKEKRFANRAPGLHLTKCFALAFSHKVNLHSRRSEDNRPMSQNFLP